MWSDSVSDDDSIRKSMFNLSAKSKSWFDLNADRGGRIGVYKVEGLVRPDYLLLRFISEADKNEEHPSVEKLLAEDNCLPDGVDIPDPIPRALKSFLYFDLNKGICYAYALGMAPEVESIFEVLELLERDTGLSMKAARIFEWKEELITTVTEVARSQGYLPYKVKADLETVKVTAEGDLENNEEWKRIEGAIDLGIWKTIAYVRSHDNDMFVFGLTRRHGKQINIPKMEDDLSTDDLLERILEMKDLIEKALGCDIREYCFPEQVKSLTRYLGTSE